MFKMHGRAQTGQFHIDSSRSLNCGSPDTMMTLSAACLPACLVVLSCTGCPGPGAEAHLKVEHCPLEHLHQVSSQAHSTQLAACLAASLALPLPLFRPHSVL